MFAMTYQKNFLGLSDLVGRRQRKIVRKICGLMLLVLSLTYQSSLVAAPDWILAIPSGTHTYYPAHHQGSTTACESGSECLNYEGAVAITLEYWGSRGAVNPRVADEDEWSLQIWTWGGFRSLSDPSYDYLYIERGGIDIIDDEGFTTHAGIERSTPF